MSEDNSRVIEAKVGTPVLLGYKSFNGVKYSKQEIVKVTPTGQLVISTPGSGTNPRFKVNGSHYICVSGDSAYLEPFNQVKWDGILANRALRKRRDNLIGKFPVIANQALDTELVEVADVLQKIQDRIVRERLDKDE